jgi:hypothetical protein
MPEMPLWHNLIFGGFIMLSITNVFLEILVVYIALDIYKKRTLDIRGLILKAIKICLIFVIVKGLITAANAVLDPSFMGSLMNRTVDIVTANVLVGAISIYTFLNVNKLYDYIADMGFGIYGDVKSLIPKRSPKKDPEKVEI